MAANWTAPIGMIGEQVTRPAAKLPLCRLAAELTHRRRTEAMGPTRTLIICLL